MTGACAQRSCSSPAQDDDRLTVIADGCIGGDCHIQDPVLVEVRQRQSIGDCPMASAVQARPMGSCRRTVNPPAPLPRRMVTSLEPRLRTTRSSQGSVPGFICPLAMAIGSVPGNGTPGRPACSS